MKLDPIFTVKQNKLYKISSGEEVNPSGFSRIEIKWSKVELQSQIYNEEYLADLRNDLKNLEIKNRFAILVPLVDKNLDTSEETEAFIDTCNHTARRVKDCISVAGFELPAKLIAGGFGAGSPAADFMEKLAIKHAQYVYFVKEDAFASKQNSPVKPLPESIVLY